MFVKSLFDYDGHRGYSVWCLILEIYSDACGNEPGKECRFLLRTLAKECRVSAGVLAKLLRFSAESAKLFCRFTDETVTISIPKMQALRDDYSRKSGLAPKSVPPKKKEAEEDKEKEPPPTPSGGPCGDEAVGFVIRRPDGRTYAEREWIAEQLSHYLRSRRRPVNPNATLDEIITFNYDFSTQVGRWLKIPIARRMGVFAFILLDKIAVDNQFFYALAIAEREGPTLDQKKALSPYLSTAQKSVELGDYEVKLNV